MCVCVVLFAKAEIRETWGKWMERILFEENQLTKLDNLITDNDVEASLGVDRVGANGVCFQMLAPIFSRVAHIYAPTQFADS